MILVRTGSVERARDPNPNESYNPLVEPGLVFSPDLVRWFYEMETPIVGADNVAIERATQVINGKLYFAPLHAALLRNLGLTLLEILDLQALGAACDDDGIYDFLFTAAPLDVPGGTGGPVNPVVLKATGSNSDCDDDDEEFPFGDDNPFDEDFPFGDDDGESDEECDKSE